MFKTEESNPSTGPTLDEMLSDIRRGQWHPTPTR